MTRPPSRSRGMACWVVKNGPLTLVAKTRSKSASVAVGRRPDHGDPGVVHQDVEPAVAPACWSTRRRAPRRTGRVARRSPRRPGGRTPRPPPTRSRRRPTVRRLGVAVVVDADQRPVPCQSQGDGPADPPRRPRHDGDLPLEAHVSISLGTEYLRPRPRRLEAGLPARITNRMSRGPTDGPQPWPLRGLASRPTIAVERGHLLGREPPQPLVEDDSERLRALHERLLAGGGPDRGGTSAGRPARPDAPGSPWPPVA